MPEAIKTSFYVDDCLASIATDVEAATFARDISAILAQDDSYTGNGAPVRESY